MSDRDMRRRYEAGSPGQRRTDLFVHRMTIILAVVIAVLVVTSLYFLIALRQPGAWW